MNRERMMQIQAAVDEIRAVATEVAIEGEIARSAGKDAIEVTAEQAKEWGNRLASASNIVRSK